MWSVRDPTPNTQYPTPNTQHLTPAYVLAHTPCDPSYLSHAGCGEPQRGALEAPYGLAADMSRLSFGRPPVRRDILARNAIRNRPPFRCARAAYGDGDRGRVSGGDAA